VTLAFTCCRDMVASVLLRAVLNIMYVSACQANCITGVEDSLSRILF
jgi:hypothetical protein